MDNKDINAGKNNLDDNILEYIKKELKRGTSKELIKETLITVGHNPMHIDLHFKFIEHKKKFNIIFYLLIAFVVLFVLSGIGNVALYNKITLSKQNENLGYGSKDLVMNEEITKDDSDANDTIAITLKKSDYKDFIISQKFKQAKQDMAQGKLDVALPEFKELIVLRPAGEFYFYLGDVYCRKNEYLLGIEQYKKAITINEKNPQTYLAMARCYERNGFHDKALELLNTSFYVGLNST